MLIYFFPWPLTLNFFLLIGQFKSSATNFHLYFNMLYTAFQQLVNAAMLHAVLNTSTDRSSYCSPPMQFDARLIQVNLTDRRMHPFFFNCHCAGRFNYQHHHVPYMSNFTMPTCYAKSRVHWSLFYEKIRTCSHIFFYFSLLTDSF